jgi:predicted nuclease with RNAse H fold
VTASSRYAGVDVGGRRKGFHGAVIERDRVVAGPVVLRTVEEAVTWLTAHRPVVVALDSPRTCAPPGSRSREGERLLNHEVCGIRWTPEESRLADNPYFEWIVHGRELYEVLDRTASRTGWEVIEVFPTASWTIWAGKRGTRRRAAWTRGALEDRQLEGLPPRRLNQDDRDAVAAALTARLYAEGGVEKFGDIVVPARPG